MGRMTLVSFPPNSHITERVFHSCKSHITASPQNRGDFFKFPHNRLAKLELDYFTNMG
jgi:hypothetical protein